MGRARSWKRCVIWDNASGDERLGRVRPIFSSMPVMKSMRRKGAEKSAWVGFRVPFLLNSRRCSAMPDRRCSVVVMRSSRLAYA